MDFILQIIVAFGIGCFSVLGLNIYSIQIEKTKSGSIRLIWFLLAVILFLFFPLVVLQYIEQVASFEFERMHRLLLFLEIGRAHV